MSQSARPYERTARQTTEVRSGQGVFESLDLSGVWNCVERRSLSALPEFGSGQEMSKA